MRLLKVVPIALLLSSCTEYAAPSSPTVIQYNERPSFYCADVQEQVPAQTKAPLSVMKASLYLDEDAYPLRACDPLQVQFFFTASSHPCAKLGVIHVAGNEHTCFDDLIAAAKQKAAEAGADFIVLSEKGAAPELGTDLIIVSEKGVKQHTCDKTRAHWAHFSVWIYTENNQKLTELMTLLKKKNQPN